MMKKILSLILFSVIAVTTLFSCGRPEDGYEVGDACYEYTLDKITSSGTDNIKNHRGKPVIIHFWGTWCDELSPFDKIAVDYKGEVTVLAIHSDHERGKAKEYIEEKYMDSEIIFLYDEPDGHNEDKYYALLGGTDTYPRTLILDKEGIVTLVKDGAMDYEELLAEVERIK